MQVLPLYEFYCGRTTSHTHSQNSVAGVVAFAGIVTFEEPFFLSNSTQNTAETPKPSTTRLIITEPTVRYCTCVPRVPAAGPRNLGGEGGEQVEEGPGLDHNVRHGGVGDHDLRGVTDA